MSLLPEHEGLPAPHKADAGASPGDTDRVARFRSSMEIDYQRWKDGVGYDLSVLKSATPEERDAIERLLIARGVRDWREVEALAAVNTPRAKEMLRETLRGGSPELAHAVTRHAPGLVDGETRTAVLVRALEEAGFFGGLTQALNEVRSFHPPAVIDALLRGVLRRQGGPQVHFAAMLLYLHGKADSPFDLKQRPYFLRFNTSSRKEREALFRDLCGRIGVDPGCFLSGTDRDEEGYRN